MAKNTDIGVDFQPDIHVEAKKLTELKFYCPLKVQREIQPSFDEDEEEEFFEDTEELSDFEILEYQSEISDAIDAYQCDDEENRGIMAYLGDRKRFADKVYSVFPSVEKVGERLMGVFTCKICGELDSYEYDELLHELSGQASDGWGEGFEQHEIHTSEGDIYRMTKAGHLRRSSLRWMSWGTMSHGKCLTARISASPKLEKECSLSDFLEPSAPEEYCLSQKQIQKLLSSA